MSLKIVVTEREDDYGIQTPDSFAIASRESVVDATAMRIQELVRAGRAFELTAPDWIRQELQKRGLQT